jgi:hypothetical protein
MIEGKEKRGGEKISAPYFPNPSSWSLYLRTPNLFQDTKIFMKQIL